MRRNAVLAAFLGLSCLFLGGGNAKAVCPVIPFMFSQGSVWNASQVNANFTSLYNCASSPSSMPFVLNSVALRALAANAYPFVQREYNVTPTDGASIWYWDGASTCTDDGLTCVQPSSAPPTGRWRLDSWSASGLTLNPGGSNNLTFDPTQTTINALRGNFVGTGTVSSAPTDTNNAALIWMRETSDAVGMGLNHGIALAEFDMNATNTTNNSDSYIGLAGNANLLNTSSGAGFTAAVGVVASARAVASQGGGLGSEKGEVHGLNVVSGLAGTAEHFTDSIGIEVDSVSSATTTMAIRQGIAIFDFGDGNGNPGVQGSANDSAITIGNRGSVGWKAALYLTTNVIQTTGSFPLSNDGCIICTDVMNAADGLDFHNVTFSNKAIRGPGDLFYFTNAGDMLANSVSSKAEIIDTPLAQNAVLDFRSAGGSPGLWQVYREATTNRFVVFDHTTNLASMAITTAGVVSIGETNGISINATGSLAIPGISTSVGSITGGLCFDNGTKTVIYKVGANCI